MPKSKKNGKKAAGEPKAKPGRKSLKGFSISALKSELERRQKGELAELLQQKAAIEQRIAEAQGTEVAVVAKTAAKRGPKSSRVGEKREKFFINGERVSLKKLILNVLAKAEGKPMSQGEVVTACRAAGYKSNTTGKFSNMVYLNLRLLLKAKAVLQEKGEKPETGRAPSLWRLSKAA